MDWINLIGGFVLGVMLTNAWISFRAARKPKSTSSAAPTQPRQVGDLVYLSTGKGLPVLLKQQLSFDKFIGCYITPHARHLGATVKDEKINEMDEFLVLEARNKSVWRDYTHPLSDGESANFAKAMLTDDK
jgi:hypothetical protein